MITAKIIKIKLFKSRYGGDCYLVCFKSDKDKSYNSYIYPKMRNWVRWKKVLKVGIILSGLKLKDKTLINADSKFKVEKEFRNETT